MQHNTSNKKTHFIVDCHISKNWFETIRSDKLGWFVSGVNGTPSS